MDSVFLCRYSRFGLLVTVATGYTLTYHQPMPAPFRKSGGSWSSLQNFWRPSNYFDSRKTNYHGASRVAKEVRCVQDRNAPIVSRLSSSVRYRDEVLSEHTLHLWILYVWLLQILQILYLSAARRPNYCHARAVIALWN